MNDITSKNRRLVVWDERSTVAFFRAQVSLASTSHNFSWSNKLLLHTHRQKKKKKRKKKCCCFLPFFPTAFFQGFPTFVPTGEIPDQPTANRESKVRGSDGIPCSDFLFPSSESSDGGVTIRRQTRGTKSVQTCGKCNHQPCQKYTSSSS